MATYVVRLTHTSDQCPTSNSKIRERVIDIAAITEQLADRLGVKMVLPPLVLGAEHEQIAVVETDRVETVNDFLMQSGLMQWNSSRVSTAKYLPDALNDLEKMPPALY